MMRIDRPSIRRDNLRWHNVLSFAAFAIILPCALLIASRASAHQDQQTGYLEIATHVSPSGGHAEPARGLTVYLLRKSYGAIQKEADAAEPLPKMDDYIAGLELSPLLKAWMVKHQIVEFSGAAFPKAITGEDVWNIPEFKAAYMDRNAGDRTVNLPKSGAREADKQKHPEKYQQAVQDYIAAFKQFVNANPDTLSTMYVALEDKDPGHRWKKMLADRNNRVHRHALELAQVQYLAGQTDTDLEGHGRIDHLAPGEYWLTTLDNEAVAGDVHIRWDLPVRVSAGRSAADLSNVNGIEPGTL
jgi:hypothetical protein|nr:hypothetical protein [Candidatus Acidoferrales bacterium]